MKNILIMGIGRAGKTTFSNMIKEKFPEYNLIHADSIKWGIIKAQGKEEYYRKNIKQQQEFESTEQFQKTLLEFFNFSINLDKKNNGYILESGQLEPKYVKELINFDNTEVICLGHGNLDKKDIVNLCREHDKEKDWSYGLSDEDLDAHAENWYKMNEMLKTECPKYQIKYIDTSKDRENILNKLLEGLVVK